MLSCVADAALPGFLDRHARLARLHAAGAGLTLTMLFFARILDKYLHSDLYPDARDALSALNLKATTPRPLNAAPHLNALVKNRGPEPCSTRPISVSAKKSSSPSRA